MNTLREINDDAPLSVALRPGSGYIFENKIRGDTIPKEFIKPIDEGIKEALARSPGFRGFARRGSPRALVR